MHTHRPQGGTPTSSPSGMALAARTTIRESTAMLMALGAQLWFSCAWVVRGLGVRTVRPLLLRLGASDMKRVGCMGLKDILSTLAGHDGGAAVVQLHIIWEGLCEAGPHDTNH